jgi:hypothetical protein
LSYGFVWVTGKRDAYFQIQDTGNHHMDYTRVGRWMLGHGEWDGPIELWIGDKLVWRGNVPGTPATGFSGQNWIKALDGGPNFVFNWHSGCDSVIGSGLAPTSSGPDQGVDVLCAQFPSAINPLHYSRIAYYMLMRKQPIPNQTNTHQDDPSQWGDINPVGLWRALRCRLFDESGNMTGYAFTTNPAWHFVDVLLRRKLFPDYSLDPVAGPDDLTSAIRARFNWSSIFNSAQYFDEILANGRRRFEGNYSFATQTSLQAVLEQILLCCRSYAGEYAGQIYLNCDQPRASVFTFTREHLLPGSFDADDQSIHTGANRYISSFRDVLVPAAASIASITNTPGGRPVVTTVLPHPFNAADWIAMGGTDTVYDGEWQVHSVPAVTGIGTPGETDPTTMVLESKGSNYPTAVGAGGKIGLLYSRFKERFPEFWHKANMLARGAVGNGIAFQRNKVKQQLDFATSTYDQVSRITRYERDRILGADTTGSNGELASPYITPPFVKLRTSLFARDAAGNLACAIRPGDRVTVDDTLSFTYAGDYEVTDPLTVFPTTAQVNGQGGALVRTPSESSGEIEFALAPYNEAFLYDDSDDLQAGWPSVPGSDPGNSSNFTAIDLAGGGTFVFFTGSQPTGSQFQLPSTGFPAANLMDWASPGGSLVQYHSMRVIEKCDADAARNLTLIYTDDIGTFWGGDVDFAALAWLSSDVPTTAGAMKWLELTLLGGEKILFGKGILADGDSFVLPAGYTTDKMFAAAFAHDTPTTATNNPRIYGAYVDNTQTVHFTYSDFAGNFWHGNAAVIVFAWKNNMGSVTTETLGTMEWMETTLTNGKKFGVGFAHNVPDGATITLPVDAGDGTTLQAIVGSSDWGFVAGAGHTWGVFEANLDAANVVHMRFGSSTATWPGLADIFALYCASGSAAPTLVTVAPATASLAAGATQQFTATVMNNANHSVVWSVDGIIGGNLTVGTIDSTGFYNAPNAAGSHTITATSVADPTASGSAAVLIFGSIVTDDYLTEDSGEVIYAITDFIFTEGTHLTTLSVVIAEGTLSARPAASIVGRLYFATDTKHTYRDNGATWDDVTPGLIPIVETVTFAGTAGALANVPLAILGLFKNGQLLSSTGGSPDYSIVGAAITLTVPAVSGDLYVAIYFH